MNPILTIAQRAALQAGKNLTYFASRIEQLSPEQKNDPNFFKELHRKIEAEVIGILSQNYQDHHFIGLNTEAGDIKSAHCWIITAIDGKDNYLRGIPHYALTLAYLFEGKPQVSVIYNPAIEAIFTAAKGEGATLNGKRIRVGKHSGKLSEALVGTAFPQNKETAQELYLAQFNQILFQTKDIRRFGATSLDLCFIACEYLNAYWTLNVNYNQFVAGALVITEAGGLISNLNGSEQWQNSSEIIACNPKLLKVMLQALTV